MLSKLRPVSFSKVPVSNFIRAFSTSQVQYSAPTEKINVAKTCFVETYVQDTPKEYFKQFSLLRLGDFNDVVTNFIQNYKNKLLKENSISASNKLSVLDFGGLYGNSSLGLMYNMKWKQCGEYWNNKYQLSQKEKEIRQLYNITGVDLSENALMYSLKSGIYDSIIMQNFNDNFNDELSSKLYSSDMMICIMGNNYMKDGRFKEIIDLFLKNRNKNKVLFYNNLTAFDDRDYHIPEILLSDVKDWTYEREFLFHRNFTPEESEERGYKTESWAHLYGMYFNKQN